MKSDPATPVEFLLSEHSRHLLDTLVAEVGASIADSKVSQVRYSPGRSCVVQYTGVVDWGESKSKETFVAAHGLEIPGDVVRLEIDGFPISIWRYPHDPFLPGLESAADPGRVNRLLHELGSPQRRTNLRRRAYRPGRRAVIEGVSPSARLFIKVVQPSKVADIQRRHQMFRGLAPIPVSHGWSEDLGLVILEARKGKTLRAALESGARNFPPPEEIVALLRQLQQEADPRVDARSPVSSVRRHARLLRVLLPDKSEMLDQIVAAVETAEEEDRAWIHGDFHSSQVLTRGGGITGLVDIDASGYGEPVDDLAGILGHLTTVALRSRRRGTVDTYREALLSHFDTIANPRNLRLRTAAVILGLATGPFRVQRQTWPSEVEQRIRLAEEWIRSADEPG